MPIFLPVAGVSLSIFYLIGIGGSVGLLSGLIGVGGGFLMTPALMFMGVPPTVAAASGSCQMVATSSSGVAAHFRLGNVDAKMGGVLLAGGLVGAAFGVRAIKLLRELGEADLVITLTYIVVLGTLGAYMFVQSLRTLRRGAMVRKSSKGSRTLAFLDRLPWQVGFPGSQVRHSVLLPFALSTLVGLLAAIMGVGGGFIMLPMMVYLLGMPTHVAVGTDLFQILFLCMGTTYMQATTNQTVDLILALGLAVASAVGAQIGARLSRLFRGEQLIIVLASVVLLVTIKMVSGVILTPSTMLNLVESHSHQKASQSVPVSAPRRPTAGDL
jgi:uncharacterized membrane protein YfcA